MWYTCVFSPLYHSFKKQEVKKPSRQDRCWEEFYLSRKTRNPPGSPFSFDQTKETKRRRRPIVLLTDLLVAKEGGREGEAGRMKGKRGSKVACVDGGRERKRERSQPGMQHKLSLSLPSSSSSSPLFLPFLFCSQRDFSMAPHSFVLWLPFTRYLTFLPKKNSCNILFPPGLLFRRRPLEGLFIVCAVFLRVISSSRYVLCRESCLYLLCMYHVSTEIIVFSVFLLLCPT